MSAWTKQRIVMQYTEVWFYKDGDLIATDRLNDDHSFDSDSPEPMTDQEIEDWS